jgi:hypothetical protein
MPIRGDKIQLETTRNDYLSITRIEVYTATQTGGGRITKTITKNISYTKYDNKCANSSGKDVSNKTKTGDKNLNRCLAACARNGSCSGAEFYAKGWNGGNCYLVLTMDAKKKAAKGMAGKRFRDAKCYVKG